MTARFERPTPTPACSTIPGTSPTSIVLRCKCLLSTSTPHPATSRRWLGWWTSSTGDLDGVAVPQLVVPSHLLTGEASRRSPYSGATTDRGHVLVDTASDVTVLVIGQLLQDLFELPQPGFAFFADQAAPDQLRERLVGHG